MEVRWAALEDVIDGIYAGTCRTRAWSRGR